jgi:DNA-binding response OmpR family regulator
VLDIGMPGLDGLEVLEQIRADETLSGMLVLLLTAKAQESDVRRGYDSGADAYVKKPFSPADLSTRVRALLDES